MLNLGHAIIGLTVLFFLVASYAILLSAWLPLSGNSILDTLAQDKHYKYLVLLMIPTTSYFVIANWVGWQYYRNS
ncbi:Phosphatidylinositol N-acetylglucosaminyltransferase subunit Y [Pleurotus pulmonarius]|nr:hypothetical protein EYR36_000878 [Pleurotus pulmonarius]